MLIARPAERDTATFFKVDARFDLVVDEVVVGGLLYRIRTETAEISLRNADYRAGRARPRQDDTPLARAIRRVKGQANPAPNPILLTDADGRVHAQAEERRGNAGSKRPGKRSKCGAAPHFRAVSISTRKRAQSRSGRWGRQAPSRRR